MKRETSSYFPVTPLWCRSAVIRTFLTALIAVVLTGREGAIGVGRPSAAWAETRLIPAVSVSERYDSNIFFAPAGSLGGLKPWDVVTSVTPTLQVLDKTRDVETTLSLGGSGNLFVNNPKLNFFSAQAAGSLKLDGLVGQVLPGLKLRISDGFAFTPEAPNFVPAGTPAPTENVFARGIQTVRANTFTNSASAVASYPITKSWSVHGDYLFSIFRVGNILFEQSTAVPVVFFNTDYHRLTAGPSYRISDRDQLSLNYTATRAEFRDKGQQAEPGQLLEQSIRAHAVEAEYLMQGKHWSVVASGGATLLEGSSRTFFSGKMAASNDLDSSTRVALDVSRQLAPAFFATGGALISTAIGASIGRRLGDSFSLTGSVNYGLNQATPVEVVRFQSYSGTVLLSYTGWRDLTPTLSYQHTYFEVEGQGLGYTVNRSVVQLSVVARWK